MTQLDRPSVDEVSALPVLLDALPGAARPHAVAAGEGLHHLVGDVLVTEVARPTDTGGLFGAAWISGPRGATVPPHATDGAAFVIVMDGIVEFTVGTGVRRLVGGDALRVPSGQRIGWTFLAHTNRFLLYGSDDARGQQMLVAAGAATDRRSHTTAGATVPSEVWRDAAAQVGATLDGSGQGSPDVVEAADGERLASWGQVNSFLARGAQTGSAYFAVHTRGVRSPWIPRHRHHLHTENFVCLDGRVRIEANGQELLLTRGDYLHAPAGTVHSFRFEGADTQMLGLLTGDVFEPFFDYMNEPTTERTPDDSGEPWFPAAGFERARAELDVEVMGPPPA